MALELSFWVVACSFKRIGLIHSIAALDGEEIASNRLQTAMNTFSPVIESAVCVFVRILLSCRL